MMNLLKNTIEYQNFGWNAITISAIATFVITILFFRLGLWNQWQTINKQGEKSGTAGESVSVSWNTYFVFLFTTILFYGFYIKSAAVIFNSVFGGVGHILVLTSLYRYKKIKTYEKCLLGCFALMPALMIALPWKPLVYFICQVGGVIMVSFQPIELWKNKKIGDIDIRFLFAYLANVSFWLVYSFFIKDWAIWTVTLGYTILYTTTVLLFFSYKTKQ